MHKRMGNMRDFRFFLFLLGMVLSCESHDMARQEAYRIYNPSSFFANGRSARLPVPGTKDRGSAESEALTRAAHENTRELPFALTREDLFRGQSRFDINCAPCHGRTGLGNGMIVQRGYSRPPNFHSPVQKAKSMGHIFLVVTNGFGAMPSYAGQVPVRDRWLIAAYIKALEVSRSVPFQSLPPDKKILLEGKQP